MALPLLGWAFAGCLCPIRPAHRLSSLRSFDRIVVLQSGQVCEDGPPQVLVRRKGVYCNLIQREVARLEYRRPQALAVSTGSRFSLRTSRRASARSWRSISPPMHGRSSISVSFSPREGWSPLAGQMPGGVLVDAVRSARLLGGLAVAAICLSA
jgi:hypothetical protein